MVRARWRWRGSRCIARVRSSALFLVAHKHKSARPARCRVVCCVFWFLGLPRALFCSISQHTGRVLRLPLGHPAGTVLRFLVFRPAPSPVSPNIAAHRPGFASALACPADYWRVLCCVFGFLGQVWALFHLISQHTDAYACRRSPVGTALPFILASSPVAGVSFFPCPPPVTVAALCAAFSGF